MLMHHKAREIFLSKLATILRTDEEKIDYAFKKAAKDTAEEGYNNGYLTKEQFENITARIEGGRPDIFGPQWNFMVRMHRRVQPVFEAMAGRLGMPVVELENRLASGEKLGEIAQQKGVSAEDMTHIVVAALKPELDRSVKEGTMTAKLAEAIISRIEEREKPAKAV